MVLVETFGDDEVFFHCHGEELNLWQNFLLLIWSIANFCVKVAQFVQSFTHTWLVHSLKHPFLSLAPTKNSTQPTQVTLNHSLKLPPQSQSLLLLLPPYYMVIDKIIPKLPKIPSVLWHLR
jgi:hypothetical protein